MASANDRERALVSPRITRDEGPTNVVYGFFHPTTGERVARLQIGRITRDYGKQGLFRVAWKARPVLNEFELRVADPQAWPLVAGHLADLLREFTTVGGLVINRVTLILGPEQMRVSAATAEFNLQDELILPAARLGDETEQRLLLPLRGAHVRLPEFSPGEKPVLSSVTPTLP